MESDVWRALDVGAGLLVAGGTFWLAVKTHKMATVSSQQLEKLDAQYMESRRPRVFFDGVGLRRKDAKDTLLQFKAWNLINLGPHAIVVEGICVNGPGDRELLTQPVVFVLQPGDFYPRDSLEVEESLAEVPLKKATADVVLAQADSLDIVFRSGSDARQRWRLRLTRSWPFRSERPAPLIFFDGRSSLPEHSDSTEPLSRRPNEFG